MIRSAARFRRFALALMLARVAAFAAAPLFEWTPVVAPGATVSAESPSGVTGVIAHDPASCPACVLLQGHTGAATAHANLAALTATESVVAKPLPGPAHTPPRAGFLSRAPPVRAA